MLLIVNCSYLTTKKRVHSKNYTLNVEEQASIGRPMVLSEYITYVRSKSGEGQVAELDSWQFSDYPTSDKSKEVLIYNGRTENTLHIFYKKYEGKFDSPRLSRELTYDLGYSDIIEFKNFKIKVIHATDEYIRYLVLDD